MFQFAGTAVLSLFEKACLSKLVLNFKTNSNTLLILFQLEKGVSNVSNVSIILLLSSMNGAAIPNGSSIELNEDNIRCLVKDFYVTATGFEPTTN